MKKTGKRSIWISIVVAAMLLTGCENQTGSGVRATGSDAVESVPSTTEVSEEATTEAALEVVSNENEKPEAVPATTEIGGGKKKAEETTEEKKPNTTESAKPSTNHSNNSGSASSGQSTAPKPSNNGNSGNSGSGNSGNSGSNNGGNSNSTPSQKPSTPATTEAPTAPATTEAPKPSTTEAPTTQHQHVYDQVVVDTPEQRIDYPEQGYYLDAVQCHICGQVFTSMDTLRAHADHGAESWGTADPIWIKTKDAYTEVIPAKTHRECKCGARE